MEIKVTGFEGVDRALADMKKSTGKAVLRRVLVKALQPVIESAKVHAPVDEGTLRDSLVVSASLSRSARRKMPKAPGDGTTSVTVYAGTTDRNGVPREFGSLRSPAHPFMRPAWQANKMAVLDTIQTDTMGEITKAAERAARRNAKAGK